MNVRPKVDLKHAARMWADDASMGEIADHFGVSRNSVSGFMNRNRDIFPEKTQGRMNLNPNGRKGYGVGSTKAKFKAAPKPPKRKPIHGHVGNKVKNTRKARMETARREVEEFQSGTSEYLKTAPSDADRLPMGKELMDLGRHDCRFALNNGGPFIFCAAATAGEVYCSHHADRAYRVREAWMR